MNEIEAGAKKAGRTLADIDIHAGGSFEISDDVDRLVAARKPGMAFQLGAMGSPKTNFYNMAFCRAGYEDAAKEVQSLWVAGKREEAANRVPDEMVLMGNFIGTEAMVRERLRAYRDVGVDTISLGTSGSTWKERTASLEEAVDVVRREAADW